MSGQPLVTGGEATRREGCPGVKEALLHGRLRTPRCGTESRVRPTPRLASRTGAQLLSITLSKPPVTLGTSVVSSGLVSSVPPPPGLPVFCVGARLLRARSRESPPTKNGKGLLLDVGTCPAGAEPRPPSVSSSVSQPQEEASALCLSTWLRARGGKWQSPRSGPAARLHPQGQPLCLESLPQWTGTGVRRPPFESLWLGPGSQTGSAGLARLPDLAVKLPAITHRLTLQSWARGDVSQEPG